MVKESMFFAIFNQDFLHFLTFLIVSALAQEFQYSSFAICLSVSIDNCKSNSREICQYQDFCPSHSKNPSRLAGLLNIQLVHKSCELSHYWRETMWYMGSGVRQGLDPHDIA